MRRRRDKTGLVLLLTVTYEDEHNMIACLSNTKTLHHIPRSYKDAIATDSSRWMKSMQVEMDMLKKKHTWDLVKPPPGANIMDSM